MITVTRFTANWCIPCKTLAPIMEEIKNNSAFSNVKFVTVDIDSNREMASKYGIRSIPTVVVENNGVVVEQLVGTKSRSEYENSIKKWTSK